MKRAKLGLISIILAFALVPAKSPAQEKTFRAGIDVPEPKIVKKVEIDYPDLTKHWFFGNHPVVLDILINERGLVTDIKERSYDASVLETVNAAVKQWLFTPTIVNGRAVPVTATLVVLFSLGYTPYPIDLGTSGIYVKSPPGNMCVFPAILTHDGKLKELQDVPSITMQDAVSGEVKNVSLKEYCSKQPATNYSVIAESDTPFSIIESKLQSPEPHTIYVLASSRYSFPMYYPTIEHSKPGVVRLYYSTLLTRNGSELIQLAGIDPDVKPPKFDIDFSHLSEFLKDSRYKAGAVYFFTVFVDEKGKILGFGYSERKNEAVLTALSHATVITPGTRNGMPVPTAVIVAIPVK
jgi:hypothetical protein